MILVGGYRFDELQQRVPRSFRGTVLENTGFQSGMLSTVQRALDIVDGYFFILPVDMPYVSKKHLSEVYLKREADRVVRPAYHGIPGHPVLCPPLWREKLLQGEGKITVISY